MEDAMRITVAACLAGLVAIGGSAQAQDRAPALVNAETCLAERAGDAVAASSGSTDAADFLLNYLCAETVSASSRYSYNTAVAEAMQGMVGFLSADADDEDHESEEAVALSSFFGMGAVSVDQTTGHLIQPDGLPGAAGFANAQSQAAEILNLRPSAELRALAGRLILEQRRSAAQ